jgi:hypothetical protein
MDLPLARELILIEDYSTPKYSPQSKGLRYALLCSATSFTQCITKSDKGAKSIPY